MAEHRPRAHVLIEHDVTSAMEVDEGKPGRPHTGRRLPGNHGRTGSRIGLLLDFRIGWVPLSGRGPIAKSGRRPILCVALLCYVRVEKARRLGERTQTGGQ